MTKKKTVYEVGSGNVFADLGLPNAEEHLIKAQLVYKIEIVMKERKLTQPEAAQLFGIKRPEIAKMLRGDFQQFSVDRLLRFLVALGQDVEIVIKPNPKVGRRLLSHTARSSRRYERTATSCCSINQTVMSAFSTTAG